jgi:hypothetical protein
MSKMTFLRLLLIAAIFAAVVWLPSTGSLNKTSANARKLDACEDCLDQCTQVYLQCKVSGTPVTVCIAQRSQCWEGCQNTVCTGR